MPFFTKRPVLVEAVHFCGIQYGKPVFSDAATPGAPTYSLLDEACPKWLAIAFAKGGTSSNGMWVRSTNASSWGGNDDLQLFIKTLERIDLLATPGDWIIQGIEGELYPCKPAIFAESYDAAKAPKKEPAA